MKSFHVKRPGRVAGIAVALCLATIPAPAMADELQEAIEAVEQSSDRELLAELQRRHEARQEEDAPPRHRGPIGPVNKLAGFDEATLIRAIKARTRVIYGPDDRKDWYEIEDETIRSRAAASVALFPAASVEAGTGDRMMLSTVTLGERLRLCEEEPHAEQASGAFCSGTLVKDDVVLTAGHCLREVSGKVTLPTVDEINFVFGFRVEKPNSAGATALPKTNIFSGKRVISGELVEERGPDWALVELDRPVPKSVAEPVSTWLTSPLSRGHGVFVIGYPSGLPVKYAPNADVREFGTSYFTANLDTFGGNSGSGVYDATTNELVGVLVRGETDYVEDRVAGCTRVNICPSSGCRGEDVTRISLVPRP